jgi:hypothetical protein
MTTYLIYYKTQDADLLAARARDKSKAAYVEGRGQAFADRFGATALFTRGFSPQFAGFTFHHKEPAQPQLWTKRSPTNFVQSLKDGMKSVPQHMRQELVKMRRDWLANWPADVVQPWEAQTLGMLGLTDEKLQGQNLHYHLWKDTAWFASTLPLQGHGLTEILATEYICSVMEKNTPPAPQDVEENAAPSEA